MSQPMNPPPGLQPFEPAIKREVIHDHEVYGHASSLRVVADDAPSNNRYIISGMNSPNPAQLEETRKAVILFQNGTEPEVGVNGVTIESLLAICLHRLKGFNSGAWACRENALAITAIEEAITRLHSRTIARLRRGVEGTHTA